MSRRQKSKHALKQEARFKAVVTAYLASLGARPGRFYDHQLTTPAGLMHVSIYGNWIACRYEDVAQGRAFTKSCGRACNPYSGKWNFHYGPAESFHPDQALADFCYHLDRLMNWKAAAA
jgi:hypothetical protein